VTGLSRPVTVGVADKQHAALSFAAEEARLAGCDVRVVHAYTVPPAPPQVVGSAYGIDIPGSFRETGREVLAEATEFLTSRYADVTVHPVLEQGSAPTVLTASSASSRLVVLGPDDAVPWYSRLFQSRVSRRLVDDALCPVVVVPDTWSARRSGTGVTLMLDARTTAHGLLRFAFEQASRHLDVLRILHVEPTGSGDEESPWHDMRRVLDAWQATYPRLLVDTELISGEPDLAMTESFEGTGLLVLGRPHGHHVVPAMDRSLARAVIQRASCPVAVVPPDHDV
jgi:nucleotide-binding universal stress UspA family protein